MKTTHFFGWPTLMLMSRKDPSLDSLRLLCGASLLSLVVLMAHLLQKKGSCVCHPRDVLEKVSAPRNERSL